MTRDEAMAYGEDYLKDLISACCHIEEKHKDFVRMAIKALEQEPCEDAVSRQAALDELRTCFDTHSIYDENNGENYIIYEDAVDMMEKLPPVTPTRKVGKWIYSGSYDVEGMLYCSNCNHEIDVSEGHFNYCPNCGAEMRGGEDEEN